MNMRQWVKSLENGSKMSQVLFEWSARLNFNALGSKKAGLFF